MATYTETTDYSNFDPDWYLTTYYGTVEGETEEGDVLKFMLNGFHEVFSMGLVKGGHLLDIGTGPCIHSIISASRHVDQIDLSDYAQQNLDILKKWKSGEIDVELEIFSYIATLDSDSEDLPTRYDSLRQKVSAIHHVDITKRDIFINQTQSPRYDVITSSLCFEAACLTKEKYDEIIKNVTQYLKKGGYMILSGVLGQTFYRVNKVRFLCIQIEKDDICKILVENGYEIVVWKDLKNSEYTSHKEEEEYSDFTGAFVLLAKKDK